MAVMEVIFLMMSLIFVFLSLMLFFIAFIHRQRPSPGKKNNTRQNPRAGSGMNTVAVLLVVLSVVFITLTIINRAVQTGHGPFSNMYEFALAFTWGITLAGLVFRYRYKTGAVLVIGLIVALLLLIFARTQYAPPTSLIPALQQSTLLSVHVASAVVAYGTLTIGFGAAILFLLQTRRYSPWLPELDVLDTISYRSVMIGFPFLTLLIALGALWADIAWGRYWGWDPKETASLVTWLIYAAYIHARVMRGWQGTRAAVFIIVGFAAIILTFFGNYIFTGLHAYR